MGLIAIPAMLKRGYDKSLTLGSVMAGGAGDIMPPSIIMIIFAYISRLSVGKFFFGGIIPGFITAGSFVLYIAIRSYLQPQLAPKVAESITWKMRWVSLREVIAPVLLVLSVLGSIFTGAATPTEAAGIGAIGALICCLIYRRFSWKILVTSCIETLKISSMALWILVAATLFGVFYTSAGAQSFVLGIVQDLPVNRWLILAGMQVILLILGCFMDDYAIVTICCPIFMPIVVSLGFDPIWFGIVFILNMQVAYLTPPFGWALFLMKGIAPPGITTTDIWRSVPPFVSMQLLVLILVMLFPQLALWLPGKMV
jgi:tripartite ATP-independent transporter DctM subunit